jgi:hypothetical protein
MCQRTTCLHIGFLLLILDAQLGNNVLVSLIGWLERTRRIDVCEFLPERVTLD